MAVEVGRELWSVDLAVTPWLWLVAILFFGVGDIATTAVGLDVPGITEASPVARPVIFQFGLPGMLALKALTFGFAAGIWWVTPRPFSIGVPLGLALFGVTLTAWNLYVVSTAVL